LADKALEALGEMQGLLERCERDATYFVTSEEAELFQYRLGALLVFCGGGVLRPSSVAGLVLASNSADGTASVRALGYTGALTWAIEEAASQCILMHVVTFKNMASYAASVNVHRVVLIHR
jgi:hypothetical protein